MTGRDTKTSAGYRFHPTGDAALKQSLFVVNPGIGILDAMHSVSDLLSTMDAAIYVAAMGEGPLEDDGAWLVKRTLDSAKAVIDSLIQSLENPDSADPDED